MPRAKKRTPPKVGAKFTKEYKGTLYTMTVVLGPDGDPAYKVGGKLYGSPSTAGKSITGSHVNGWVWWKIEARGD